MHPETCKSFKVLSILLSYPHRGWVEEVIPLCDLIDKEQLIGREDATAIRAFAHQLLGTDIYDAQEDYVDTFDRTRSLSLHLFEHVHGESRDRGQAMADLIDVYKEQGLSLAASELPDYLPLFLEYLSLLPKAEALGMLAEPVAILMAISKRLAERGSPYHIIFDALIRLTGKQPIAAEHAIAMSTPNYAQLDKEWEEKPIEFLGAEAPQASGCGGGSCGSGGGCGGIARPVKGAGA